MLIFTLFVQKRRTHVPGNICILFYYLHTSVFTNSHACALRCPDGGGHSERTLLLPRVYLPTVTLMQCNDYFYSRYFGSPLALSGMTPHWPADYLCGCCHTWLLQALHALALSPPLHLKNVPPFIATRSSVPPSFPPLSHRTFTQRLNSTMGFASTLFGLSLCSNTLNIPSSLSSLPSLQSLHLHSSTSPNLVLWFQSAECVYLRTFIAFPSLPLL